MYEEAPGVRPGPREGERLPRVAVCTRVSRFPAQSDLAEKEEQSFLWFVQGGLIVLSFKLKCISTYFIRFNLSWAQSPFIAPALADPQGVHM
jgi:hypothetical protein